MPLPAAPKKRADSLNTADFQAAPPRRTVNKGQENQGSKPTTVDREEHLMLAVGASSEVQAPTAAVVSMTGRSASPKAPPKTRTKPHLATSRPPQKVGPNKLFVLDTNVLLHDPSCLFQFKEHDIFLPMVVLEELDAHKKGLTELARNARQMSRSLDELVASPAGNSSNGVRLAATGQKQAQGHLIFETELLDTSSDLGLPTSKADNKILAVVKALRAKHKDREVVLVSNDINMRIKARALGLPAEDYSNDKALDDTDLLYTGTQALNADFWEKHATRMESWQKGNETFYRIRSAIAAGLRINQFVHLEPAGEPPFLGRVIEITGNAAVIKTIKDFGSTKNAVMGVTAKNREQNFALNLLMDPEVDFVTLAGTAGSGKTLLALAAGLRQTEEHRYAEIIMTRATVSVGEDIGFLPGNEEEKMSPWMGALDDNLEFLSTIRGGNNNSNGGDWSRAHNREALREKIKIKSLNFMRGRTFLNKYVIIDEAQNLTPKQMKTLITRAGPGTKIVCMGNLAQIDTPYLTESSSGFTFAVDRFKGWPHGGHITMLRGERSRLADFASEVL